MAIKIVNPALMLFPAYMGIKHGWSALSGKQEVLDMFHKWNIGKYGVMAIGFFTIQRCTHADCENVSMGKFFNGCRNSFDDVSSFARQEYQRRVD
jgi:hypothetical protein